MEDIEKEHAHSGPNIGHTKGVTDRWHGGGCDSDPGTLCGLFAGDGDIQRPFQD